MIEQRTVEWKQSRLGFFTGSQIGKLMKGGRGKDKFFGDTALSYIYDVASQRYLKEVVVSNPDVWEMYDEQTSSWSRAIQFGVDWEEEAKKKYYLASGNRVEEVGSIEHPSIPFFSASPDGMTNEDGKLGVIEVKCHTPAVFMKYVSEIRDNASLKDVNPEYYYQTQAEMMVSGAFFCDFTVFNPFMKNPLHIIRIIPEEEAFSEIEKRVRKANDLIEHILEYQNGTSRKSNSCTSA